MQRTNFDMDANIIILIDGECLLCHRLVRFVCKRDAARRFRFAALRSEVGRRLLEEGKRVGSYRDASVKPNGAFIDSFVMIEDGHYYFKSTAALRVLRRLDGLWPLFYGAVVLPICVRDGVYDFVAKRRHQLFGRGQSFCEMPSDELRGRLIEEGQADVE